MAYLFLFNELFPFMLLSSPSSSKLVHSGHLYDSVAAALKQAPNQTAVADALAYTNRAVDLLSTPIIGMIVSVLILILYAGASFRLLSKRHVHA
jgi:hypothetical protein